MLPEPALAELARDIEANGLRDPICVWDGMIVDGRNRMAAINLTMRAPLYREMEFKDDAECVRYIVSMNIHRRHLTVEQRADIADELAKLGQGARTDIASKEAMSQEQAAKVMGVSRSTVQRIHALKESAPDLAAKVKSGEIKVSKAASMAHERQRQSATAPPLTSDANQADDAVADAKAERAASGRTDRQIKNTAAILAMDATEITAHIEDLRAAGYIK